MTLNWNRGALAEGLACYRSAQYFEAHEYWENVWLTLHEPEKSFLQALIQITAAFHHFEAGNCAGAASLLRRALRRLELYPADFGGIAIAPLRVEVMEWLSEIESGAPSIPADYPQIRLVGAQAK